MEQDALPPHGLYYVTRDASKAYLLDGDGVGLMYLAAEEMAVLVSQLELAGEQAERSRSGSALVEERSPKVSRGGAANALGVPHGVYYVATAGDEMYDLTAEDRPDMARREAAVAVALIRQAAGGLSARVI